jgi:hypothetical protein
LSACFDLANAAIADDHIFTDGFEVLVQTHAAEEFPSALHTRPNPQDLPASPRRGNEHHKDNGLNINMKHLLKYMIPLLVATLADAAPHQAFVTSTSGNGNLASWADAGNNAGLAAGDAICQARATAAGLPNPTQFGAWLSDASNDAYCRAFTSGGGTLANACGQISLPTGAGPWVRLDGLPFASTIENALRNVPGLPANYQDGVVFSPLLLDENGHALPSFSLLFTATQPTGTYDNVGGHADCGGWTTSDSSLVGYGISTASTNSWTAAGSIKCSVNPGFSAHLICMQKDPGESLSGYTHFGNRVAFVTRTTPVTGDLSQAPPALAANTFGINAGDSICQADAVVGHLYQPKSFKALLTSNGSGNIMDRFQFDGPWFRPDGLLLAHNKAEIVSNILTVPPNVSETNEYLGVTGILTGANADGSPSGKDCNGWTSASAAVTGTTGIANRSAGWIGGYGAVACSFPNSSLLCLSDADVVFHSEFEIEPYSEASAAQD